MMAIVVAAGVVSIAELDAVSAGQLMLSRPIVVGPLLGAAFGRPDLGLMVGLPLEFMSLDDLPVGGHLPLNATVAAAAALLMALGPWAVPLEAALPAGLGTGWVHKKLEEKQRQKRSWLCQTADARLVRGQEPPYLGMSAFALAGQAAVTLMVLLGAVFTLGPLLRWAWPLLPYFIQAGLKFGLSMAPWLACAALLRCLRPRA